MARQLTDRRGPGNPKGVPRWIGRSRFRAPRLPAVGRPRRLSSDEVAALKARPWPRLPWWLWLAVAVTTVAMVVVATGLVGSVPDQLPVAARRHHGRPLGREPDHGRSTDPARAAGDERSLVSHRFSFPRA